MNWPWRTLFLAVLLLFLISAKAGRIREEPLVLTEQGGRSLEEDEAFHNLESLNNMDYSPPAKKKPIHN
ncbi:hypothetical protein M5K25_011947 [Dendrobium thyrsiflorum]|uniref:Uncharacterized protein n=1 Tax=Dendrobium thyrsiflorum TaxID=117978 RepID=A0ABD0VB05_DENTH